MCVRSRREQGEQGEGDEVAERGLGPANLSSTLEPGWVDEEDDRRDRDLPEPPDDEERRRENDAPEPELRKADCGCKVEHVPGDPENQRTEQDRRDEYCERNEKPAGNERADPEYAQHDAEGWTHTASLCVELPVALASKLTDEMSAVKLTVVRDEMEAEALCGLLRTNGIACFYRKTDSAGAIGAESGGFAIAGPTEVLVSDRDLDAARELLSSP
jgi:hypothetical protein